MLQNEGEEEKNDFEKIPFVKWIKKKTEKKKDYGTDQDGQET